MDFKTYTEGALKTESKPQTIIVDKTYFNAVTNAIIGAGNLLDVIKKDAYYGLPKTQKKLNERHDKLVFNKQLLTQAEEGVNPTPLSTKELARFGFSAPSTEPDLHVVDKIDLRVMHGVIGIVTESVEMLEALNKALRNDAEIDGVNLLEEFGDLAWYMAITIDALGGDWNKILEANLAKLAARNKGTTFNADATVNRNVDAERVLLEEALKTSGDI